MLMLRARYIYMSLLKRVSHHRSPAASHESSSLRPLIGINCFAGYTAFPRQLRVAFRLHYPPRNQRYAFAALFVVFTVTLAIFFHYHSTSRQSLRPPHYRRVAIRHNIRQRRCHPTPDHTCSTTLEANSATSPETNTYATLRRLLPEFFDTERTTRIFLFRFIE